MADDASLSHEGTAIEQALIGAAISERADVDQLLTIVQPSDFYHPAHETVWAAVARVREAGHEVDIHTVKVAIAESGTKVQVDPLFLIDALQQAPHTPDVTWHAEQVVDRAERRRIAAAARRIEQYATSAELDLPAVREKANHELQTAFNLRRTTTSLVPLSTALDMLLDATEQGQTPTLGTGWPDLDRTIRGLAPGRLVVVGARPGVGKSLFGTNLALHFAGHHKHAVLIASLEMDLHEVTSRLVSAEAEVNVTDLTEGHLSDNGLKKIAGRYQQLHDAPIYIFDQPSITLTGIRAMALEVKRRRSDLALIVVDYLQLMDSTERFNNRVEAIGQISRGLKNLARETGACVVAMAQLNRQAVGHADGKPRLSDLRESGSIEADANVVILLSRRDSEVPEVDGFVAKNRHGPQGEFVLQMRGHYAQLVDATWSPTPTHLRSNP